MPNVIAINDPEDPRIEAYRDIRERDLVGRDGLFIAEGTVVLHVLLRQSRFRPVSLLLLDRRVDALGGDLERVPKDVPVYVASQPVLDKVAGFPMHRGVLALGDAQTVAEPALDKAQLVVVGIGLSNHDNVGGLFRNAAAFGADAVLLDETSSDPLYRKAIRVSVGASLVVPFARAGSGTGLVTRLLRHGMTCLALSTTGAQTLSEASFQGPTALVLGSEGPGLPQDVLSLCQTVRISMAPGWDSLNVATAAGITLYQLRSLMPHSPNG
ncbi:MAG: RNA methyltransferase [Pseudomonadota bacterium]